MAAEAETIHDAGEESDLDEEAGVLYIGYLCLGSNGDDPGTDPYPEVQFSGDIYPCSLWLQVSHNAMTAKSALVSF